jgi:hypothetical protein
MPGQLLSVGCKYESCISAKSKGFSVVNTNLLMLACGLHGYRGFQRYWTYRHSEGGVRSFATSGEEGRLFQLFTAVRSRRTG